MAATTHISQERTAVRHYQNPIPGMLGRMPRRSLSSLKFQVSGVSLFGGRQGVEIKQLELLIENGYLDVTTYQEPFRRRLKLWGKLR
ncbi:MAG: hypothetical protein NT025_06530, partial [bacterium]|nr:hypothetical protein [bacterium]